MSAWTEVAAALAGIPDLPGAACRGRPGAFDLTAADDRDVIDRATAICETCPALDRCRAWVDATPAQLRPSGVVAGQLLTTPKRPDAPAWLAEFLSGGAIPVADVKRAAAAAGYGRDAIYVAVKRLGVVRVRTGRATYDWRLPEMPPDRALAPEIARPA